MEPQNPRLEPRLTSGMRRHIATRFRETRIKQTALNAYNETSLPGLSSRTAALSSPLASSALYGAITFSAGQWENQAE